MQLEVWIAFVFILGVKFCSAQVKSEFNVLSLAIGKNGLIYNMTFDHKVPEKFSGYRVGLGQTWPDI